MELAAFVALWPTKMILGFTRAELAKILGRLGDNVGEELHLDTAKGFTCGFESDQNNCNTNTR